MGRGNACASYLVVVVFVWQVFDHLDKKRPSEIFRRPLMFIA
ncbi:hypothetical protein l11_03170 [Neisseria weaveri LMG 5135]|nr:hypothetical protein l11_03170 [Neisseria weaveri LMG 5135]